MNITILLAISIIAIGIIAYVMEITRRSPEDRPTGRDLNWTDALMATYQIVGGGCIHTARFAAVFAVCWSLAMLLR